MKIMQIMASEVPAPHPKRRFYSLQFKVQVTQECARSGASVAGVALAHGINANIVHRWLRESDRGALALPPPAFVAVRLDEPAPAPATLAPDTAAQPEPDIRVEVRRANATIVVKWPLAGGAAVIRVDTVWLATEPLDMRAGADTALARVVKVFGAAHPHSAYLFTNKRVNRMKVLVIDGLGIWLAARRLHWGRFVWPGPGASEQVSLSRDQFDALVLGLPWARIGPAGIIALV